VQYLLMRGETESLVAFDVDDDGTFEEDYGSDELQESIGEFVTDEFEVIQEKWVSSGDLVINPPVPRPDPTPESLARGKEIFLSARTECSACHGEDGAGRGPNVYDAVTGTFKLKDIWGNPAEPADLRKGIYRGGNRPLDLYWRISGGIHGTPMPSFDESLQPQQIWDVVNYVYSIPYLESEQEAGK
jgi:mono/diheme cytochrome c family protein